MFWLESKSLKFGLSLLITPLALAIFFLLQFEDLLEWGFCYGRRDIIFTIEILYRPASASSHQTLGTGRQMLMVTNHFTQQKDVLATHEEDATRDIGVEVTGIDSFNGILEDEVCCTIAPGGRW